MDSYRDFYFQQKVNPGFLAEEGFAGGADFDDESNKSNKLDDSTLCPSESAPSVASSVVSESSMEETEGEGDDEEEETSSSSSSNGPLQDMSSLLNQLPFKRGLSKHYQGKSQSFTSLTNVLSLEDLAKPENPYSKKLKSCRSYAGGLSDQTNQGHGSSFSGIMSKKASRGSCLSQMCAKRDSSYRPPMAPHRSTSTNTISNHTALYA